MGEFAEHLTDITTVLDWLVNPRATSLPAHVQCVYIQAVGKLFSRYGDRVFHNGTFVEF